MFWWQSTFDKNENTSPMFIPLTSESQIISVKNCASGKEASIFVSVIEIRSISVPYDFSEVNNFVSQTIDI